MKLFTYILALFCSSLLALASPAPDELPLASDEIDSPIAVSETTLVVAPPLSQLERLQLGSGFASHIDVATSRGPLENTGDLLSRVTGVMIRHYGGPGSTSTLSIRGLNPGHVEVFLDEVPLRSASFGYVNLSSIDLNQIESIDIYRSTAPTNLGGESAGAAVCLKTHSDIDNYATLRINGGSYNTRTMSATANGTVRDISGFLSISRFSTDGNFVHSSNNGTEHNYADDFTAKWPNGRLLRESLLGKLSRGLPGSIKLVASTQFWRTSQGLTGTRNRLTYTAHQYGSGSLHRLDLSSRMPGRYSLEGKLYAFAGQDRRHYRDPDRELAVTGTKSWLDQAQDRYGGGVEASWGVFSFASLGLHSFDLLAEIRRETLDNITSPGRSNEDRRQRSGQTISVGDRWKLLQGDLHFDLFYRWDEVIDNYHGLNPWLSFTSQPDHKTRFHGPRLGCSYHLGPDVIVKTNWSRAARFPTFSELFGYEGALQGNPELEPELGRHWDIGLLWRPAPAPLGSGFSTELVYYRRKSDQTITYITISDRETKPINLEKASLHGLELTTTISHLPLLRDISLASPVDAELSVILQWQSTRDEGTSPFYHGKELTYRPRLRTGFFFRLTQGLWGLRYDSFYQGKAYWGQSNLSVYQSKDYWTHDLQIHRRIAALGSISLRVENLLDQQFEDIRGYPLPGRSWYGGIELRSRRENIAGN